MGVESKQQRLSAKYRISFPALVNGFVARHEVQWELAMMALAIAFVAIGFLPDLFDLSAEAKDLLRGVDFVVTGIFVAEFSLRFSCAPSKVGYLKGHWVDLVALLPATRFLRLGRLARVARLLRLLMLIRVFNAGNRLIATVRGIGAVNGLQWVLLTAGISILVAAGVLYFAESGINDHVQSYWDGLWWALVTIATVGYGDIVPVTVWGRLAGAVIIVVGITSWGLLVTSMSGYLLGLKREQKDPVIGEIKAKLDQLPEMNATQLRMFRASLDVLIEERLKDREQAKE